MTRRLTPLALILAAPVLLSACVIASPGSSRNGEPGDLQKMGEQAVATCGAGNVKEVSARSFSCK
ncbi:hypothetical protein LZ017_18955 [Pelomonas sp. CA6]|uniref:hypothetical protein n=1 Tax=Pelomonas sp. CA6 TaxID=2907999 RepID=UPI001F4BF7D3|nr:hypothetical protein [Pelomonas sp. CA6]MCH7345461.1 hypothetical protein [Pelomonas sp. CA6]